MTEPTPDQPPRLVDRVTPLVLVVVVLTALVAAVLYWVL